MYHIMSRTTVCQIPFLLLASYYRCRPSWSCSQSLGAVVNLFTKEWVLLRFVSTSRRSPSSGEWSPSWSYLFPRTECLRSYDVIPVKEQNFRNTLDYSLDHHQGLSSVSGSDVWIAIVTWRDRGKEYSPVHIESSSSNVTLDPSYGLSWYSRCRRLVRAPSRLISESALISADAFRSFKTPISTFELRDDSSLQINPTESRVASVTGLKTRSIATSCPNSVAEVSAMSQQAMGVATTTPKKRPVVATDVDWLDKELCYDCRPRNGSPRVNVKRL